MSKTAESHTEPASEPPSQPQEEVTAVWSRILRAVVACVVLLVLFLDSAHVLEMPFFPTKSDTVRFLVFVVLAAVAAWISRRIQKHAPAMRGLVSIPWEDIVFLVFLGLATTTTFSNHPGYYFLDWPIDGGSPAAFARSRMVWFFALCCWLSV